MSVLYNEMCGPRRAGTIPDQSAERSEEPLGEGSNTYTSEAPGLVFRGDPPKPSND